MNISAGRKYNQNKKKRPGEIFGLKIKQFAETKKIVIRKITD